jgi:dTDP-4-dehydrorhamnose reductase
MPGGRAGDAHCECLRRRVNTLRLLCFSSDLVFDGTSARPSAESDDVAPLSAYGRSKADTARAIEAPAPMR